MTTAFHSANWHRVSDLTPRLRRHGRVEHHRYRGRSWYVLHDPATGKVHRFTPAAYALLRALDGDTTIDQAWRRLADDLAEAAPSQDDVIDLLSRLHRADILQGHRPPDAEQLQHLVAQQRREKLITAARQPLSITLPLWDADAFLTRHAATFAPLFTRGGLLTWAAIMCAALLLGVMYGPELAVRFGQDMLSPAQLALTAAVFVPMKLLHEAGHACALKAFGGPVHRTGLILLAFLPMPYVDASAAAALPSKSRRILVGAAGMMAELLAAAIALIIWLLVEPGLVREVAFAVLTIAMISVVIVNGNPLLRFDAYFMLSDLIEIPNLAQRSSRFWSRRVGHALSGARPSETELASLGERAWFAVYGPAAFAYRLVVLLALSLWVASEYLAVGVVLALVTVLTTVLWPLSKGIAGLLRQADAQGIGRTTRLRLALLLVIVVGLAGLMPAPLSTRADGIIWLPDSAQVRAGESGFVAAVHAAEGAQIDRGAPVLSLVNSVVATELRSGQARVEELRLRLAAELPSNRALADLTRTELAEAQRRLASAAAQAAALVVRTAARGTLAALTPEDLPGRHVRKGDTVAIVRPAQAERVRVLVRQDDIDLVRHRLRGVVVALAGDLTTRHTARVLSEVPAAATEVPSRAFTTAGGGRLEADGRHSETARTTERVFQFELALDTPLPGVPFGGRVLVRFDHVPEPIASQVHRRLRQLFLSYFHA